MTASPHLLEMLADRTSWIEREVAELQRVETTSYPIFNVRSWGAAGDGTGDDGPAQQAAIDAAIAAGGGTIYYPPGIYRLPTAAAPAPDGIERYIGDANHASHLTFRGDGATLYVPPGSTPARPIALRNSTDILVEGLTFDHQYGGGVGQCLGILNSSQVIVRNCRFINADVYGIAVGEDTYPLIIATDISFSGHVMTRLSGGLSALYTVGETVIFAGAANAKNNSGFVITGLTDTTITVAETFTAEAAGANIKMTRATGCDDLFFVNNTLENIGVAGIIDFPKALSHRHLVIENALTDCGNRTTGGATGVGIKAGQATDGCIVAKNAFDRCNIGIGIVNWETTLIIGNMIADSDAFGIVNTLTYHPTYHTASFQDCLITENQLVHRAGFLPATTSAAWCLNGSVSASWGQTTNGPIRFVNNEVTDWTIPYAVQTPFAVNGIEIDNNRFVNCLYSAVGGAPVYQSPSIVFIAATKTITDGTFGLLRYTSGQVITVTLSVSNNGSLTIDTVADDGGSMTVLEALVNESSGAPGPKFAVAGNPIALAVTNNVYRQDMTVDLGTLVIGTNTITAVGDISAWRLRDIVKGANVPVGTSVTFVDVPTATVTMSANASGSAAGQVIKHARATHVLMGSDGGRFVGNTLIRQQLLQIQGTTLLVSGNAFSEPDIWGLTATGAMVIRAAGVYTITRNDVDNGVEGTAAFIWDDGGVAGVTVLDQQNVATPLTILPFATPLTATLSVNSYHTDSGRRIMYAAAIPVGGTYNTADLIWYTAPVAGGGVGAVCTAGGTPGTWAEFGIVDLVNGILTLTVTDTGTTNIPAVLILRHRTSGTPAAGFGTALSLLAHSSTNADRAQFQVLASWATATDGTRKAQVRQFVFDTAGREFLRGEASGTAAMIGVLGAAASARINVTGAKGGNVALANLLTAMATFGWITDSTT